MPNEFIHIFNSSEGFKELNIYMNHP